MTHPTDELEPTVREDREILSLELLRFVIRRNRARAQLALDEAELENHIQKCLAAGISEARKYAEDLDGH